MFLAKIKWIWMLALSLALGYSYDFSYCLKNYQAMALKFKDGYATPIEYQGRTYFVYYSKKPILDKAVMRSDPFIGLYVIDSTKAIKGYVIRTLEPLALEHEMAVIRFSGFVPARVLSAQSGFLEHARLNVKASPNQIVSNICYQIYGITTEDGFVDKRYIERFLSQEKPYYGDIGVRLKKGSNAVAVIDPFFEENPFLPDDRILSINGKRVAAKDLEWEIANLPYGSVAKIKVERKNLKGTLEQVELPIKVDRAYGGLLLQDSFFESQGIKIDKDLSVRRVHIPSIEGLSELRREDRILWIDGVDVRKLEGDVFENVKKALSDAFVKNGFVEMLISRNGFQFNLKLYPKNHFSVERIEQRNPKPKPKKPDYDFKTNY